MKKNIGFIAVVLLLLGVVFFILFIHRKASSTVPQSSSMVIKIESEYWPGSYWVEVAERKGWFKEAGLTVQLIDATSDYNQSLQDMVDGKMDENNFTLYDLMKFNAKGADLVSVVNTDVSSGTEALLAPMNITSIANLKGKRIGTAKGTYLEYILDQVLKRNNMTINDITLVDIVPEKTQEAFDTHTIDAALTYEPTVGQVIQGGKYHKLFDTSEILGAVPSVIAFHRSFISQHPEIVQKFVNVWNKTTNFMLQNSGETNKIIATYYSSSQKATEEEAKSFTEIDKILSLQGNQTAFSYSTGFESLYGTAKVINEYMLERGLINQELDATSFLDGRFIHAIL